MSNCRKVPNEIIQLNCHNIVLSRWRPPLIQMAIQSQIPLFCHSIRRVHVREIQLREFSINYIIIIFFYNFIPFALGKENFHGICTIFTRHNSISTMSSGARKNNTNYKSNHNPQERRRTWNINMSCFYFKLPFVSC